MQFHSEQLLITNDKTNKKEFSFPFILAFYIPVKGKPLIGVLQLTDNGFVKIFDRDSLTHLFSFHRHIKFLVNHGNYGKTYQ